MTLFTTPASTTGAVFQTVSDNLSSPGLGGFAIMVIGIVAVFWVLEMIISKFRGASRSGDSDDDDMPPPGAIGRSFDIRS